MATSSVLILSSVVAALISFIQATPSEKGDLARAVNHLARYGYLREADAVGLLSLGQAASNDVLPVQGGEDTVANMTAAFKKALTKFQTYGNISATGELDEATMNKMKEPRCGMKDLNDGDDYSFLAGTWPNKLLRWRPLNYTPRIGWLSIEYTFFRALSAWDSVCGISFARTIFGEAEILITFASQNHGDQLPFDGPGGVLAHAYSQGAPYPLNGDAHFDSEEPWTLDTSGTGINLHWTAMHEFGHSIGLGHSSDLDAIMYPYYRGDSNTYKLSADDIAGCRAKYGP